MFMKVAVHNFFDSHSPLEKLSPLLFWKPLPTLPPHPLFTHVPYFLTYAGRKDILLEKQISISTCKYRFHKGSEKFMN